MLQSIIVKLKKTKKKAKNGRQIWRHSQHCRLGTVDFAWAASHSGILQHFIQFNSSWMPSFDCWGTGVLIWLRLSERLHAALVWAWWTRGGGRRGDYGVMQVAVHQELEPEPEPAVGWLSVALSGALPLHPSARFLFAIRSDSSKRRAWQLQRPSLCTVHIIKYFIYVCVRLFVFFLVSHLAKSLLPKLTCGKGSANFCANSWPEELGRQVAGCATLSRTH